MHSGSQMSLSGADMSRLWAFVRKARILGLHLPLKFTDPASQDDTVPPRALALETGETEGAAGAHRKFWPVPLAGSGSLSHLAVILCLKARPTFCAIKLMDFSILEQLNSLGADAEGYGCSN